MKKLIFIAIYTCLLSFAAQAQKPVISGVSPGSGTVNTTVVITGASLPTGADALVQFGAAQGTVLEATTSQIKAAVPAGTSYSKITVTNKSNGLSAESSNPFLLSFGGTSFDLSKFAPDFSAGFANYGMFDMCSCDFNGDGKVDVVSTHENSTSLSAFRNTSTPEAMSFIKTAVSLSAYSRNIICGDVDGDGRPDLIVSGNGTNFANRIFVLRNISTATTLSFSPPTPITLTRSGVAMLALHDLNGDGRPELVATNKSTNVVTILKNNSTAGTIQFIEPQDVTINGPYSSHGISVQDLDGDGKADLAVTPFYDRNVYLLRNTSSGSTISFAAASTLSTTSNGLINIISADLNGDGKAELAAVDLFDHQLLVWTNSSTSGSMQFGSPSIMATGTSPWGIVAGDVDGNGKTDLAVHHLESRSLAVFHNSSSNGTLQLSSSYVATTEYGRHLAVVDLNGDAKPDLAYTGISQNNLRVIQNKHQVVARLSPSGTITLCSGQTATLQATQAQGVTYQWTRNGATLASTDSYITVSEAGDYKVTITSTIDGYTSTSETVRVVAGSGSG
ncbi:MAG: VCBS repeat-containing protein, partial [Bacteroidetes bacterium]|nr:VCBS repeat-containing protein [Bacteroidota bacterium]